MLTSITVDGGDGDLVGDYRDQLPRHRRAVHLARCGTIYPVFRPFTSRGLRILGVAAHPDRSVADPAGPQSAHKPRGRPPALPFPDPRP
jgi:hypothetical protein